MIDLSYEIILDLLEKKDLKTIKKDINLLHPGDIAQIINELPSDYKITVFRLLDDELASDVLPDLFDDIREDILEKLQQNRLVKIIDEMESDEAADIIREKKDTTLVGSGSVFQSMNSTVTMNLAVILKLKGINLTISAACASGSHSIGLGYHLIKSGLQNTIICGGAQEINAMSMGSFDGLMAFSRRAPRIRSRCLLSRAGYSQSYTAASSRAISPVLMS